MAKYLAIKTNDIDNGDGLRVSVWFSGCPHKCRGCHNPETWDKKQGVEFTDSTIDDVIKLLDGPIKQDLSVLGGEPLAPYNVEATVKLVKRVREALPNISIWLWTGYDIEQLSPITLDDGTYLLSALSVVDVIVDGRYAQSLHIDDKYRGSSNQRVIDNKKSISSGHIEIYTN